MYSYVGYYLIESAPGKKTVGTLDMLNCENIEEAIQSLEDSIILGKASLPLNFETLVVVVSELVPNGDRIRDMPKYFVAKWFDDIYNFWDYTVKGD